MVRLPDNGIIVFTDYGNNTPHTPTPQQPVNTQVSPGISVLPRFERSVVDSVNNISRERRVATSRPSSKAHYTDYG
jgi:hypothetical protein